jgi:hypothetical protein
MNAAVVDFSTLHRFPKRVKKSEDCRSFAMALRHWKTAGGFLVHARFRFQRFAAMSAAGDSASPCHLQSPNAEWAAPRPFVTAFRTCAENKVRAAQELVAFPKGDYESTVPVCADQEFFQDGIPFAIGRF